MKFTIDQAAALRAMQFVTNAVASRETIPILGNVLIETYPDRLRFTATDLDMMISADAKAHIEDDGKITLEADRFLALLKSLPEGADLAVNLTDKGRASIMAGRARFAFPTLPATDFPSMPRREARASIEITASTLSRLIDKTRFSGAQNDIARAYLNGVYLHSEGGKIRMVATDGHRLARADADVGLDLNPGLILPRKLIEVLRSLCGALGAEAVIGLDFADGQFVFTAPSVHLVSKVLDGEFPHYERVIPTETSLPFKIDVDLFRGALRRALVASDEQQNREGRLITAMISDGKMQLASRGSKFAEGSDEIEINGGEEVTIGFNGRYLLDVADRIETEEMIVRLGPGNGPVLFTPSDGTPELFVVMPLRA